MVLSLLCNFICSFFRPVIFSYSQVVSFFVVIYFISFVCYVAIVYIFPSQKVIYFVAYYLTDECMVAGASSPDIFTQQEGMTVCIYLLKNNSSAGKGDAAAAFVHALIAAVTHASAIQHYYSFVCSYTVLLSIM